MELRKSNWQGRLPWILSGTAILLAAAAFLSPACRRQHVFASQDKTAQEKECATSAISLCPAASSVSNSWTSLPR
jgi:hypothetical protein